MARYPNYHPAARPYGGTAADAVSPARVRKWLHPEDGFLHALHVATWGDLHYRITGVDAKGNVSAGGRLAEQPPHGDAPAAAFRGEYLRGTRRPRRMVPRSPQRERCIHSARGCRSGQGPHRGRGAEALDRVPRQRREAGAVRDFPRPDAHARRPHVHGALRAAAAERLADLSRRRRLPAGHRGLRPGRLLPRCGRRQRGLREQL